MLNYNFISCTRISAVLNRVHRHLTSRSILTQSLTNTRQQAVYVPTYSNYREMVSSSKLITPPGTICIEGNIGCGKTTLLDFFRRSYLSSGENNPGIYMEPVENWRNVEGENLFHYLYKDPTRYSLAFQTYVQLTMIKLHSKRPKLMERSIYSARYCFVENLYKLNYLSRLEYIILDKWFKHLVLASEHSDDVENRELEYNLLTNPKGVKIDLIIYLRCPPQRVMERIKVRSRAEEKDISYDYVKSIHDLHENWLMKAKFPVPAPVLVLDTNCKQTSLEKLYEKAAPYISGQRRITSSPTIISLEESEDLLLN